MALAARKILRSAFFSASAFLFYFLVPLSAVNFVYAQNGPLGPNTEITLMHDDGLWRVAHEPGSGLCMAFYPSGGAINYNVIVKTSEAFITISDEKFSWMTEGKTYTSELIVGKQKWKGEFEAYSIGFGKGFILSSPQEVSRALSKASYFQIRIDGTLYGPFSLKGSANAIKVAWQCQERFSALAAKSSLASKNWKPLSNRRILALSRTMHPHAELGYVSSLEIADWLIDLEFVPDGFGYGDERTTVVVKPVYNITLTSPDGVTKTFEGIPLTHFGVLPFQGGMQAFVTFAQGGGNRPDAAISVFLSDERQIQQLRTTYPYGAGSLERTDDSGDYVILARDVRFDDGFDAFAYSSAPVFLFGISDNGLADVTLDNRNRAFLLDDFHKHSESCNPTDEPENRHAGNCAGFLASAARLGLYESAVDFFDLSEFSPPREETLLSCLNESCTKRGRTRNFEHGLKSSLLAWGYLENGKQNAEFYSYFKPLTGELGFNDIENPEGTECFDENKYATGFGLSEETPHIVSAGAYAQQCNFQDMNRHGFSVHVTALCRSENFPLEIRQLVYEKTPEGYRSIWGQNRTSEHKKCDYLKRYNPKTNRIEIVD